MLAIGLLGQNPQLIYPRVASLKSMEVLTLCSVLPVSTLGFSVIDHNVLSDRVNGTALSSPPSPRLSPYKRLEAH